MLDHLLQCDNNRSFDEFTFFAHRNKKFTGKKRKYFDKT